MVSGCGGAEGGGLKGEVGWNLGLRGGQKEAAGAEAQKSHRAFASLVARKPYLACKVDEQCLDEQGPHLTHAALPSPHSCSTRRGTSTER